MFNTAQRWGYIKKNPFNEVSLGKIRTQPWHFITPDEFKSLLNVVDNLRVRKKAQEQDEARIVRLKAFYSVMYGCGLRFGEAVNLLWNGDNIDFDKKQINLTNRPGTKILPIFKVKDYEARSIPMPKWVVDSLIELKPYAEEGCPFTFLTKTSWNRVKSKWMMLRKAGETKKWNNKDLMGHALRYFKKYCKFAGIKTNKKLTLHGLRKGYGTNLANMSTPAHTLKELMGHSSITTSMKYYLFSPDANKKKAVEGLDELMQ